MKRPPGDKSKPAGKPGRGGARPGAGRPRIPATPHQIADPLELLKAVARGELVVSPRQFDAAVALLPYWHKRPG